MEKKVEIAFKNKKEKERYVSKIMGPCWKLVEAPSFGSFETGLHTSLQNMLKETAVGLFPQGGARQPNISS